MSFSFFSTAHQLHQPSVCHPVHGRPQQPQLSRQHGWKEGASLPGRRGHERPAGVELGVDWTLPTTLPCHAPPSAEPASSLILCLWPTEKKSNKKKKKARTLYKMYKMKDYFFKWLQYYILFFQKIWWQKRNHFIDIYSVLPFNFAHLLLLTTLPPPLSCI